jgi:hypothetical protein
LVDPFAEPPVRDSGLQGRHCNDRAMVKSLPFPMNLEFTSAAFARTAEAAAQIMRAVAGVGFDP